MLHCYKSAFWSLCLTVQLIGSGQRRIDTSTRELLSQLILSYVFPEILVKSLWFKSADDSCVSSHPKSHIVLWGTQVSRSSD